jgi:hypothetical protein
MRRILLLALTAALAVTGGARAQTLEDRLRSQLAATTAELHQLQAAQSGLAADKAAAETSRDALQAQLAAARAKLRATPATPSEDALAKARAEQAAADQARLDQATAENGRLAQELAALRAEHERVAAQAKADGDSLKLCRAKHAELMATATDILAAYDHVSAAGMLASREPVIGLGRLPAQRRVQAFSERLYAARLDVRPKDAAAAATPPSTR